MAKKTKLMVVIFIVLSVCMLTAAYLYNEHIYATRTIKEKVDFRGKQVSVNCEGVGSPTVIFEPGLELNYMTFKHIESEISKNTRTFMYDRLKIWRERKEGTSHTTLDQVTAFHELLQKMKVKGAYIIVAHSIAGFNARLFTSTYPKEVAGIIFVDCSHENQQWNNSRIRPNGELNYQEILDSAKQVREANKKDALRNIPITVLTAGGFGDQSGDANYQYWLSKQKSIAALSDRSKHIIVPNSGHIIQTDQPQALIDAINEMIDLVRGD